jgi:uncharacterized protein YdaU (DUF1376 family)
MAAFASLPLFTDAWVADTKHLSRLARGTYMDLLILIWRSPECRVPNDDAWLAPRLAMTLEEVAAELRPLITEFCQSDGNWVTQKRLRKEFTYCNKKREIQSVAAKARWDNNKKSNSAMPAGIAPSPSPSPSPSDKKEGSLRSPPRNRGEPIKQDWIPSERNREDAKEGGLSEDQIVFEGKRFRDNSIAKGILHKNIDAAWRNWCTSPYRARAPATNGHSPRPGSKEDRQERTYHAHQKLKQFIAAGSDDEGRGGEAGRPDVRLLPFGKPVRS